MIEGLALSRIKIFVTLPGKVSWETVLLAEGNRNVELRVGERCHRCS